jgi:hypothetical protein
MNAADRSDPITDPNVAAVFASVRAPVRKRLLELRRLILDTAADTEGVGEIEETLRWGEPSYLTKRPKSGTTIRINQVRDTTDQYALYVNCQTSLVDTYRQMYGDLFAFEGNRAIILDINDAVPRDALAHCIALALRYHVDKTL